MHKFKDKENNSFSIDITLGKVKKVKSELGLDLLALFTDAETQEKVNDPLTFVDMLYLLCEEQIKRAYKDENQSPDIVFGEKLDLESLEEATGQFMDALIDFFQEAKRVKLLRLKQAAEKQMEKEEELMEKELEKVLEQMDSGELSQEAKQ